VFGNAFGKIAYAEPDKIVLIVFDRLSIDCEARLEDFVFDRISVLAKAAGPPFVDKFLHCRRAAKPCIFLGRIRRVDYGCNLLRYAVVDPRAKRQVEFGLKSRQQKVRNIGFR
jgi:hypothetical protein